MRECDNSKIHINSKFLLSICLIIMLDTLLLVPPLHCNTSLHLIQCFAVNIRFPHLEMALEVFTISSQPRITFNRFVHWLSKLCQSNSRRCVVIVLFHMTFSARSTTLHFIRTHKPKWSRLWSVYWRDCSRLLTALNKIPVKNAEHCLCFELYTALLKKNGNRFSLN